MPTHSLDCKSLKCPMPIVKLAMALRGIGVGEQLLIEATDPAFLPDLQAWSRMTGNELCDVVDGPVKQAVVRKVR